MLRTFFMLSALLCSLSLADARSGEAIPFTGASAESADGSHYQITWQAPGVGQVDIFASHDPARFDGAPVLSGRGASDTASLTLAPGVRWYFKLVPDKGQPLVIADRSLHLSSVANFRDAGGYRTVDGKWVPMGLLYRSNALDKLSSDDLARVSGLGIKLVCDLRTETERQREPDVAIPGSESLGADVMADAHRTPTETTHAPPKTAAEARASIELAYREFVDLPSAQQAYHDLFMRLANPAALPTIFHCTAGKDRTGWAQAVLLTILGVPQETILDDYALTNRYLAPQADAVAHHFAAGTSTEATQVFLAANPDYLRVAFAEVAAQYGTFDAYLHRGLNLDDATIAAIRRNFRTE